MGVKGAEPIAMAAATGQHRGHGSMAYPSRNGAASRAIALDLMLRTFMNSPDFQPYNPRVWDSVAKLVPGTTAQQCFQRWEELKSTARNLSRDFTTLSAKGRPISANTERHMNRILTSQHNYPLSTSSAYNIKGQLHEHTGGELPSLYHTDHFGGSSVGEPRQSSSMSSGYRVQSGKFAASFCHLHLGGGGGGEQRRTSKEEEEEQEKKCTVQDRKKGSKEERKKEVAGSLSSSHDSSLRDHSVAHNQARVEHSPSFTSIAATSGRESVLSTSKSNEPVMVIHVHDEAKKLNKDFTCARDVLIKEMEYFSNYLSSPESQQWEEVDINVHCDINVFEWLMQYVKQGKLEGPCGEELTEPLLPPQLEPGNVVSVLISSDFLKMGKLVGECLVYCYTHLNEVLASPCNMNCIGAPLLSRLALHFSPLELESIVDPKDKIKSKLYNNLVQRLFQSSYNDPQCLNNASSLFRCQHCGVIMTSELASILPCHPNRVTVDKCGQLVHRHKRDGGWESSQYLKSLRQSGTSWRGIYWRVWGLINWLVCTTCGQHFQCSNLISCAHHPQPARVNSRGVSQYMCCKQSGADFSPMSFTPTGCCFKQHTVLCYSNEQNDREEVYQILLQMKDLVCQHTSSSIPIRQTKDASQPSIFLHKQMRRQAPSVSSKRPNQTTSVKDTLATKNQLLSSSSQSSSQPVNMTSPHKPSRLAEQQRHIMVEEEEEEEDDSSSVTSESSPSEVEEDNEEEPTQVPVNRKQQKKKLKKTRHQLKCRSIDRVPAPEMAAVLPPHNWLWDSNKSNRLNQDMQRYCDEYRLKDNHLTTGSTVSSSRYSQSYAGGVFSRLEAQFRSTTAKPPNSRTTKRKL